MKTTSQNIVITGTRHFEQQDTTIPRGLEESSEYTPDHEFAVGFKNIQVTVRGKTYPLTKHDDKFIIYSTDISEAWTEFWMRWNIFTTKVFGRRIALIENK